MKYLVFIGHISLNISFILYLILYLPQVLHNRQSNHLAELSLAMHYLLFLSYFFDLFYGFIGQFQWQYKTVSIVGLSLISIQHIQLTQFLFHEKKYNIVLLNLFVFLLGIGFIYYFFMNLQAFHAQIGTLLGSFARICGFLYCLPQIIKNRFLKSASALNIQFIYLNMTLALLDTVSSWCLNWGWPNKLASPVSALIMIMLLIQKKQYKKETKDSAWIENRYTLVK